MKKSNPYSSAATDNRYWYFIFALFMVVLSYSCSHKVQAPAVAVDIPKATPEQLVLGKNVYVARCQKCHKLHKTTEFRADKWDHMITKMAPKAKLTEVERENVRAYILNSPLHK